MPNELHPRIRETLEKRLELACRQVAGTEQQIEHHRAELFALEDVCARARELVAILEQALQTETPAETS